MVYSLIRHRLDSILLWLWSAASRLCFLLCLIIQLLNKRITQPTPLLTDKIRQNPTTLVKS